MAGPVFALNHMVAPKLALGDFFAAALALGIHRVEIRNDLTGNAIIDGTPAETVRVAAGGLEIISINALQRFNEWSPVREAEARALASYAAACGAKALVLVPVNDGSGRENGARQANLRRALEGLAPILEAAGIIGLVEPLGFEICSLRSKREALEAIHSVGGEGRFKLVHDTFHHVLAGEGDMFPGMTGLVHISGVDDPAVAVADMRDPHRVMVGPNDRLDNVGQIRRLLAEGYAGPFSFEPFAASVHANADPVSMVGDSIAFIQKHFR